VLFAVALVHDMTRPHQHRARGFGHALVRRLESLLQTWDPTPRVRNPLQNQLCDAARLPHHGRRQWLR